MSFEELGQRLRSIADLDATAEMAAFTAETGSTDPDDFLAYLRERDRISGGVFCALHAAAPIRVTAALPAGAVPSAAAARPVVSDAEAVAPASPSAMTVVPVGLKAAMTAAPGPAMPGAAPAPPQYRILGRIGAGAMGEVHVARDAELGRTVAFKRMVPELVGDASMTTRFYAEAQITAQLDHPNVVSIYDLEVGGERALGYAMKLVEGRHLGKVIDDARARLTAEGRGGEPTRLFERLRYFLAVCDAIAFAHSKGVLHRDLKPENIMVGRHGQVYVMDWGICRLIGATDEGYGAIVGTPAYMSPEQAAGKVPELDARSDLYALGLILYELVALRPASPETATLEETLAAAQRGDKRPLGRHVHGAPIAKDLAAVIAKATAVAPGDRYADVAALARDLRAFVRGDPVSARRDSPVERVIRWVGRHKGHTLIILLGVLLAAAAVTLVQRVLHERRIEAAHHRTARLEAFQLAVAREAHTVDAEFFRYERALARLAGQVAAVLASSDAGEARAYLSDEFENHERDGRGPSDLAPAKRYGGKLVSFHAPVFQLRAPLDRALVAGELGRLVRLRPAFTALMLETAPVTGTAPAASARARILDEGVPAYRTFVTLVDGVHVSYPGVGGYPPEYDGTRRPKYLLADAEPAGSTRIVWGDLRGDRHGQGLIMAAATRIHDADGKLAAVTGMEMTFDSIARLLRPMADAPYIEAVYLVNEKGQVVVGTDAAFAAIDAKAHHISGEAADAEVKLDPLPYPEVRAALAGGKRGRLSVDGKLIGYAPIAALGWTYVVVAEERQLMAADRI